MNYRQLKFIETPIVYLFICFFLFACSKLQANENIYDENFYKIENKIYLAMKNMDKEEVLKKVKEITDDKLDGNSGKKYLHLKIMALTFCGEYKEAYNETQKGLKIFPNDYEILIADGLLANKLNFESNSLDFAYLVLHEKNAKDMNENEIIAKYYLSLILDKPTNDDEIIIEKLKPVILYYSKLNKIELLKTPPLGFLLLEPIIIDNKEKADGDDYQWFD
jgi:hypothetical protein